MEFEKIIPASSLLSLQNTNCFTVTGDILALFAEQAFRRLAFTYSSEHLETFTRIVSDPAASENDRLVAVKLLENAVIASKERLPLCQDTGVAQIFAWKDSAVQYVQDKAGLFNMDTTALSFGVGQAYKKNNLRFSINIPFSLFDEKNSATNLPAQIDIFSTEPHKTVEPSYRFLFCAKGGGSSNKTDFTCATKALLTPAAFEQFLRTKIAALGTAACPPYNIAVVIGGLSPEQNLATLKLATTGYWQELEQFEADGGSSIGWTNTIGGVQPLRCRDWEEAILHIAAETGLGVQFGGIYLATHASVFRLPRHGASCFASIGVSCNAHRNLFGYISREGGFLQRTVTDPQLFFDKTLKMSSFNIPKTFSKHKIVAEMGQLQKENQPVALSLDSISSVCTELSRYPVGQSFIVSGDILVARDAAHARWKMLLDEGKDLPSYTLCYPILYAGPAEPPHGAVIGSFGPTTANRMDAYADELMRRGAALITIAKGNRSEGWTAACKKYGAFYLGTIGGAAALIAEKHITSCRVLDYPDLGMEAVHLISVKNLPVFLITDDKGNDFYAELKNKKLPLMEIVH